MNYKIDSTTGLPALPDEGMYWEIGDNDVSGYSGIYIDREYTRTYPALFLMQEKQITKRGKRNWMTLWFTHTQITETVDHIKALKMYAEPVVDEDGFREHNEYTSLPLDKETTLKLATKALDNYWSNLYTQALAEDESRTRKKERAKIYGKYPPKTLS